MSKKVLKLALKALPGPLILLTKKPAISKLKFAIARRFITTLLHRNEALTLLFILHRLAMNQTIDISAFENVIQKVRTKFVSKCIFISISLTMAM